MVPIWKSHAAILPVTQSILKVCITLALSCGPQAKTPGRTHQACAGGRQLQWVVRCGSGIQPTFNVRLSARFDGKQLHSPKLLHFLEHF
jgi:hypothetical protein